MIAFSLGGYANTTNGASSSADQVRGTARQATPSPSGPSLPRNQPERTVPCVIRVIAGVGVAVFPGQEYLLEDIYREINQSDRRGTP